MRLKSLTVTTLTALAVATAIPAAAAAGPLPEPDLSAALALRPTDGAVWAQARVGGTEGSWTGATGVADLRTGRPATGDERYRIGSVTKVFTATIALQLAGEGVIALDAPVQDYLPGLLPEGYPAVPVGSLLNHTSGLPVSLGPDVRLGDVTWELEHRHDSWTAGEVIERVTRGPLVFPPGTAQQYNGMNTILAGMLIEEVTGHTYGHQLRKRITGPLGLKDTYTPADSERIRGTHLRGYQSLNGEMIDVTAWNQSMFTAEGDLISTTKDLETFVTALFQGRLLAPAQQELLFTLPTFASGQRARFSSGLMAHVIDGTLVWGKTGSRPGYTNGVFATRDGRRVIVYAVGATDLAATEMSPVVGRIAQQAF